MTVLEMQSPSRPTVRWTEVCTTEHDTAGRVTSSTDAPTIRSARSAPAVPADGPSGCASTASPADRRRVRWGAGVGADVRACRMESTPGVVVDDVPTWVLLAGGVAFGLVLLLLVALVGGPAYA